MTVLSKVLADLALNYFESATTEDRDCRLIFPGLTDSLAIRLQRELRERAHGNIPVYLALDFPNSDHKPNEALGWLHYEALTSVRHGSFLTVCMPKILPKLQDSIYGSGSPIRGLSFADDWPWNDIGMQDFRFDGPVLDAILDAWQVPDQSRRWVRDLVIKGLLPTTAPLRDAIRVSVLLEEILGEFTNELYPQLRDFVDKFCYHCGIPKPTLVPDSDPQEYIDSVVQTARAFVSQRSKNPTFREHLVSDIAPNRFSDLDSDSLDHLIRSIDDMLDGAFSLGVESRLLAYRGGIGVGSSSATVESWSSLCLDTLIRLFGTGESSKIQCTVTIQEGSGILSSDKKQAATFEGVSVYLEIGVKIDVSQFAIGEFAIQCKRRQRVIFTEECNEPEFNQSFEVPSDELPPSRSRLSLVVQLLRSGEPISEARVYVHICGENRPVVTFFEPGFEPVDLAEHVDEYDDSESVKLTFGEPFRLSVLDSIGTVPCSVTTDSETFELNTLKTTTNDSSHVQYSLQRAIDVESYSGARVELQISASNFVRFVTIEGEEVKPGEFTVEDELRTAVVLSNRSRLRRVLPLFHGEGEFVLPKLGELDAASRRRLDIARVLEKDDGWKPILGDFVSNRNWNLDSFESHRFWRTIAGSSNSLQSPSPTRAFEEVLERYEAVRSRLISRVQEYVEGYENPPDRPLYVVGPTYVERDEVAIETVLSDYLEAYQAVLNLLQRADEVRLSPGEILTLVYLDSTVLNDYAPRENALDLRIALLGPWHPLVVSKRFMVQCSIYAAAISSDPHSRKHAKLVSLFERVDGFRLVPGFDPDSVRPDVSFAFPTSDPGWHLLVSCGAFPNLKGSRFGSLRGFGALLRESLGLRSSLYLAATDLWSESFVRSYQRSHPSRRSLGVRVGRGLDARPIVDSCAQLVDLSNSRSNRIAELLPGGMHLFLEETLTNRQELNWQQPSVSVYEAMEDELCYENFRPDIHLRPQNEEMRLTWVDSKTDISLTVPRGIGRGSVFSMPLVQHSIDTAGLPFSLIRESLEGNSAQRASFSDDPQNELPAIGDAYRNTLVSILELTSHVRSQQPVLRQQLGLPSVLKCDWTVLPGAHVDAGALATYITGTYEKNEDDRTLWDYRLDLGQSVKSYFIVSKVPKSILSSLAAKTLDLDVADASLALRELGKAGFAVGETMRSGKAAVGVLGLVGALRLARAAWSAVEADGRRRCTLLLPVDCMTDLLVTTSNAEESSKRTDLLAVQLVWRPDEPASLAISACAIECKYVSGSYSPSRVTSALSQASATYKNVTELFSVASLASGMHARLAISHMLRFGLRLLSARGEINTADERSILEASLSGEYQYVPPIASSILVTTSCEERGSAKIEVQERGWWVQLTRDSWPRGDLSPTEPLVQQLANAFQDGNSHNEHVKSGGSEDSFSRKSEVSSSSTSNTNMLSSDHVVPTEKNTSEPNIADALIHPAFDGFVGNREVVEKLSLQLKYAEDTDQKTIDSIGLFGPKSTGKTELSRRIASALNIPYLPLSETSLQDVDQLANRMQIAAREAKLEMPVIGSEGGRTILQSPALLVFVDEVHQLSRKTQDSLLPVLEADDRVLRGSRLTIDAHLVSFVIATTDWGKLRDAFRSRVASYELKTYTADEVAKILQIRIVASVNDDASIDRVYSEVLQIQEDALIAIATAARAVPREALRLLRELGKAHRVFAQDLDVDSVWKYIQDKVPCDRNGLTSNDHRYLKILYDRGPIGVDNVATELGLDKSNVESAIEPFLSQMGWVVRGSTGRYLSHQGRRLVEGRRSS